MPSLHVGVAKDVYPRVDIVEIEERFAAQILSMFEVSLDESAALSIPIETAFRLVNYAIITLVNLPTWVQSNMDEDKILHYLVDIRTSIRKVLQDKTTYKEFGFQWEDI